MILIDYKDKRPLYEQVVEKYKELILSRVLQPGEKMPSVRQLAMDLSITPNTVQRAYSELEKAGFLFSVTGRGNFVAGSDDLLELHRTEKLAAAADALKLARRSGVTKQELMGMLEEIYGGDDDDTD